MLINLRQHFQTPLQKGLFKVAGTLIEKSLAIPEFNEVYARARDLYAGRSDCPSTLAWFESVLKAANTTWEADLPPDWELPKRGPLIIVANHPFGILDPCVLAAFVAQHRPDLRMMANFLLGSMPELLPWIIAVDPFGGAGSAQKNLGAMKECLRFLKSGGALAIFPAGEVAHHRRGHGIEEQPWSSHVGSLVRRTQASVLPVYFPGRNSLLFHAAGHVHPRLRTALLLREFRIRQGTAVEVRAGRPIPFARLRKFEDDESLTKYLRLHTFVLAQRKRATTMPKEKNENPPEQRARSAAHVFLPDRDTFRREVDKLRDKGSLLASRGSLSVYVASANEIPNLLPEIGRLREITFREVGEGSGRDIDLDYYDRHYLHLFLWDDQREQIAGAYRLGRADLILREHGPKGLYTSTLFKFEKPFLAHLESAVEMGRSFVCAEYQRRGSLPLLWKGIFRWVGQNPQYKKLFGAVSISKDYDKLSRKLIVEFLEDDRFRPVLADLVKPRQPFHYPGHKNLLTEFISAELQDVDDCSALISSIEADGKGIPVLLKHYIRLKGTILSFNVDKAFSSVLDGLILVDFTETDPRLLSKYMGVEACRFYLAHHGRSTSAADPCPEPFGSSIRESNFLADLLP